MNHSLALNFEITKWEDSNYLEEIRKIAASGLSDTEFEIFIAVGKTTNLNPFLKEIWATKSPADKDDLQKTTDIFISIDGHRKAVLSHLEYEYHQSEAVYSNDECKVVNGEITHNYKLNDRGQLIGAYCIVKRKSSSKTTHVSVSLSEWDQTKWKEAPEVMIKKLAEVEGLRFAFADLFSGTILDEDHLKG